MLNRSTEAVVYTFMVEPTIGDMWKAYPISEIFIPSLGIMANQNKVEFRDVPRSNNTTVIPISNDYVRELMIIASLHKRYEVAFKEMRETEDFTLVLSGQTQKLPRHEYSKFTAGYRYTSKFQPIFRGPLESIDEIFLPSLNILFNAVATFTESKPRNKMLERREEPALDPIHHVSQLTPIEVPEHLANRLQAAAVVRAEADYALEKLSRTNYHRQLFSNSSKFLEQFGFVRQNRL